jgi:TPR repeat protein
MPRRSKRIKTATQSGGVIGNLPRAIVVHVLKYFDINEVARLQRLVCREFRDAGQERIHERGGRKLFEEGIALVNGYDHQTIDNHRGCLMLQAARDLGCRTSLVTRRMSNSYLSDEEKQKILKDLKEIATTSPYHWVDYYIGMWYFKGWGGEEKTNQAVVWYAKAIKGGNAESMFNLGIAYAHGNLGLTQSLTKANELLALAAEKGHAEARFNLGVLYEHGTGVEIDFNRCVELWEQSAKQGCVNAQFNLANIYRDGSGDNENGNPMTIPKNHPLCFKWALAAAKQGDGEGQTYTGDCYKRGWGVERNYASAFEWYMKAAEQEEVNAQYYLGQFFEDGKGRDIDIEQALFWYRKAAAQEDQMAMEAVERLA